MPAVIDYTFAADLMTRLVGASPDECTIRIKTDHQNFSEVACLFQKDSARGRQPYFTVLAPTGVTGVRTKILQHEEFKGREVQIWNDPHDRLLLIVDNQIKVRHARTDQNKVVGAGRAVEPFLKSLGISVDLLEKVIKSPDGYVAFLDAGAWAEANAQLRGSALDAEGLTEGGKIKMNKENYTVGAIAHELFHLHEHDRAGGLGPFLLEGCTEYFTQEALGIDQRWTRTGSLGPCTVYSENTQAIRKVLDNGGITQEDIINAYFNGEQEQIKKIVKSDWA
ncbi:hypothetical protein SAMN05216371_0525 [Streptomyces sp. TLI_053]|uniref:hypothetical protein n=1 Tax=Streptomyces sp. TLI_053 TaxID=1855352 RepID=UPI00087C1D79|nr:hypothetical protein [Streptomyces sp. TLI_053]SDS74331.1 hypothetical protein SAMN05216371_0525 [Streptomyces sp. TLI_053]